MKFSCKFDQKNNFRALKLILLFASIFLFTSGCSHSEVVPKYQLSLEEKKWMEKFFKDLLLEESGIFTLCGSKPITAFEICLYSPEELKQLQEKIPEESRGETILIKNYDFPENWEKWEKIKERYDINKFLFFKKENPEDPKLPIIFLVNILETALVIQENYSLFRQAVDYDFDSLDVVFEIEDPKSKFWTKVFNHSELMGILYGFGTKNASCFYWKFRKNQKTDHSFVKTLPYQFSDDLFRTQKATIENFSLPIFSSFFERDEKLIKYNEERKKIKQIYKNRDFVEVTLEKFTE